MSRTRTALRLALGAGLGALALASPAAAATVSVERYDGHDYLRYAAAGGETNQLRVSTAPDGRLAFTDDGAGVSESGNACSRLSDHEVRCGADAAPALVISLGDRDDQLVIDVDTPTFAGGEAGNDRLTSGPAGDGLWGGDGDDVLDGRGGADLLAGEAGTDTVRYADRTTPVTVNLVHDGLGFGDPGTEGQVGERDTVASDIERVVGGSGNDSLTGNDGPNLLDGGGGNDTIVGAGGIDDLRGGSGSDTLRSRDGGPDRVNCGGQPDAVEADPVDVVSDCEAPAPAVPTGPGPSGGEPGSAFTFGAVNLPEKPVTLYDGRVTLTVACPQDTPGGRCTGVITLERKLRPARRATVSRRTKRRGARVGVGDYAVRAGGRTRVRVRVSRAERLRVARTGSDSVQVFVSRSRNARKATRIGTLKVQASRRTKRRRAS